MKPKIFFRKRPFLPLSCFVLALFFSTLANAQSQPAEKEEPAICKLKVNNKEHELKANKLGIFPQVSNVLPLAIVPITVTYPQGTAGEKVVVSAEDGGWFDNKKSVTMVFLNAEKKCVFNFHLTPNEGLFEIILRKGNDTKVVQLWVGEN